MHRRENAPLLCMDAVSATGVHTERKQARFSDCECNKGIGRQHEKQANQPTGTDGEIFAAVHNWHRHYNCVSLFGTMDN